jgi:phosphate transport system permease protein
LEKSMDVTKAVAIRETKTFTPEFVFQLLCLVALTLPLLLLMLLIVSTFMEGLPRLGWTFLTSYPSRIAARAGLLSSLAGTVYLMVLTAVMAVPVGIGAAIYLEEYARPTRLTSLIELNISNLAGVPSIIYGLLGLGLFVRFLSLNRSLVAGAATLALLLLPMVIIASREALRTVPHSMREACYALGGDKWRSIRQVVLPMSLPGIMTGIILSLARAIGETAPLITIGALTYIPFVPTSVWDEFTAIPIQVFNWVSRPQAEFHINAAAGVIVLLAVMLALNGAAIWLRLRLSRRSQP